MESFKVENLSFTYPNGEAKTLDNISFSVEKGELLLLCGKSGCGKTTLLRLLKSSVAPYGKVEGEIFFEGKALEELTKREQSEKIGFVMQNVEAQIVTDKVWNELAFGLESLGYETSLIRTKVGEMASFFGIQQWFYKNVNELSGGQKQLLNLASVMVMNPSVLILDEPTSQLDPIASEEFLQTIKKINRELGVTVILTEHNLESVFSMADRIIVMDEGRILADNTPEKIGEELKNANHDMQRALPTPMRIHSCVENDFKCPITVREGRAWLERVKGEGEIGEIAVKEEISLTENAVEIKDVWFRYDKNSSDVVKGLNLTVKKGEIFAILGGNGTGKTTTLNLISKLRVPYRGRILINGEEIDKIKNLYTSVLGVLPQNPQILFSQKTLYLDLMDAVSSDLPQTEKEKKVANIAALCRIDTLLERHPYDLSGGEQERAGVAKVLLKGGEILLLDEPTKGMDAHFKEEFADMLKELAESKITIIMATHDVEFCAEHCSRCALFFDGNIISEDVPRKFFKGKHFYTTATNRMARDILPEAICARDVVEALGGKYYKREPNKKNLNVKIPEKKETVKKPSLIKKVFGGVFALLFAVILALNWMEINILPIKFADEMQKLISIIMLGASLWLIFPQKEMEIKPAQIQKKLDKKAFLVLIVILFVLIGTLYAGVSFFGSRKYYITSMLVIAQAMIPFLFMFEKRKPQAREIVIISLICALAVTGRAAFFMLPQFKPVIAIIIIAGVCFGAEAGFLVGAVTGFVSNFFFGQGPWTPWQMVAFGIIGFIAGVVFRHGFIRGTKLNLCIFGFLATLLIYGGIMNPASVIMWQNEITWEMLASAVAVGIPFDLVHAVSVVFFLWFISKEMIEKIERIKVKYGIAEKG